ncbi:MAG: cytochrome c oxidase subunit II [Rhodospirillaceae bacterium]|jgi:cytochrome c oxidase subunit II|nr:cytochrome c oxidase subunit II [Rhodospirillaceae bacterium]
MRLGKLLAAAGFLVTGLVGAASYAAEPVPWQLNLQPAVTPVMQKITEFHDLLLVIIILISIFVLILLGVTMWKFGAKRNPVPTTTTHNTMLEMLWTVVPVIILVVIAVPSFKLLYLSDVTPAKVDMTIKATGNQWYWTYEYPDHGKFSFDSNMIPDNELKPGQKRLLETDTVVVVPVNQTVRVQVTASDVLHAWAIPAFGVKIDGVPGRLNEIWFKATKEGTYYGQCSELCGVNHGFMPIRVDVVSKQKFDAWAAAQRKAAGIDSAPEDKRAVAALKNTAR